MEVNIYEEKDCTHNFMRFIVHAASLRMLRMVCKLEVYKMWHNNLNYKLRATVLLAVFERRWTYLADN